MNTKQFHKQKNSIQAVTLLLNCVFLLVRMKDYVHSLLNYQLNMQELEDCWKCLTYWWEWLDISMLTQIFQADLSQLQL